MFKGALEVELRFPVHPFIVTVLADLKIYPCQLYPNSWRFIILFMLKCHALDIPMSTPLFWSIFFVKNSGLNRAGWLVVFNT